MSYEIMTPYVPQVDFSDDEARNVGGRSTVLTAGLDTEHDNLKTLSDAFISNINLMLRSDGRIKDKFVELHGLHPNLITQLAANLSITTALGTSTFYGADTGVADAIVASVTPAPESYFSGFPVWVLINATCTGGPVTADIAGLGVVSVKQADGTTDPAIGELQAGGIAFLVFDGTVFQHINKTTASASVSAHLADTANPHAVTLTQVGLAVVDPASTDTTRNKLVSNNDIKLVEDYRAVGHLPLAGGTVSGAVLFSGAVTLNGLNTFGNTTTMNAKQFRQAYQSVLASATTTDLSAILGNTVTITGTTAITALGTAPAGTKVDVIFAGALNWTHNATSMILIGNKTRLTASGDTSEMVSLGSGNWKELKAHKADGQSILSPAYAFDDDMSTGAVASLDLITGLSGVTEIHGYMEISFNAGNTNAMFQLGDSGGFHITGYSGRGWRTSNANNDGMANSIGFNTGSTTSPDSSHTPKYTFSIIKVGEASGKPRYKFTASGATDVGVYLYGNGTVELDTEITQLRVRSSAGTALIDGGHFYLVAK